MFDIKIRDIFFGKLKIIGIIIVITAITYGVINKVSWQYYPLYILGLLYLFLVILNYFKILNLNLKLNKWFIIIAIIIILITMLFLISFPMESIPVPQGEFKVATKIYDLEDNSRLEVYSENKNDKRKIKYQVWYPTDKINGYKKNNWITEGTILTRQLAKTMHIPYFMLDHTSNIESNSYFNAPLSNNLNKYPVIIISHGWQGFRELHTDYAEDLASNGFIVVSIDHTYGSQAVKFKDGKVAYLNKEALPSSVEPDVFKNASRMLVTTYGKDVSAVLDDLEKMNTKDKDFKDKLDLNNIGIIGHSTGGGGSVYASLADERIKALLGLDAWVNPLDIDKLKNGLEIPALFLRSEQWGETESKIPLDSLIINSNNSILIEMNKTTHLDFTMTYMYSPLTKYIGLTGKLGGRESSDIQREIALNFFDKNLRNNNKLSDDYLKNIVNKYEHLNIEDIK